MADLKTIQYRGGVVTFRIPSHWAEEYEPEGGGTFYEPSSEDRTLRLNVTTIEAPRGDIVTGKTALKIVELAVRENEAIVESRPDEVVIAAFRTQVVERNTQLIIYYWQVVQPIPPRHARSALFSFSVLAANADHAVTDLTWIDREVRACRLYPTLGTSPPRRRWRLPWAR